MKPGYLSRCPHGTRLDIAARGGCDRCFVDQDLFVFVQRMVKALEPEEVKGIFDRYEDYRAITPLQAVNVELGWQEGKFGKNQELDNGTWLTVLVEEVGECALALNTARHEPDRKRAAMENLEVELIQVAASALAWVKQLRRQGAKI